MKKLITIITIAFLTLGMQATAFAQDNAPPIIPLGADGQKGTPDGVPSLKLPGTTYNSANALQDSLLPTVTKTVIALTGGLALLFCIVSGILILTAFGNEERLTSGKKTFAWSLIGLLISILSYAIVQIIISIKIGT